MPNCLAYEACSEAHPLCGLVGPLAARTPGLGLPLGLEIEIERHCSADEILKAASIRPCRLRDFYGAP